MKILIRSHCLRTAPVVAAVTAGLAASPVNAQSRATIDVSAGATAATNPYLLTGSDRAAAGVDVSFSPAISVQSPDAKVNFAGSLELEKFFGKYGLDESVSLGASGERYLDERTTLSANVEFRSSKSAARRFYTGGELVLEPGQFPDTPEIDPTLATAFGRTNQLDLNASLTHMFGPKSTLAASAGLGLTRVQSAAGTDYRNTSLGLTYTRLFSETTSALMTVDGGYADYLGRRIGDGVYVTALAGIDKRFSRSLHASAQAGATLASIETVDGSNRSTTSWAAKINLCDEEARGATCLTGSRSTQPTSFGGLTTVSSLGLSYSRAMGPRANLSFTGSYARSSRSVLSVTADPDRNSRFLTMSGTYRRKVGESLAAFVTPSFVTIKDGLSGRRENFQVLLGISHTFGRAQ